MPRAFPDLFDRHSTRARRQIEHPAQGFRAILDLANGAELWLNFT
jgi:hypothetical protein